MRRSLTLSSLSSFSKRKESGNFRDTLKFTGKHERYGVSPSNCVIRNILNYSLALSVIQTKDAGTIGMMMN
ncbi:MAG: hypothetical protein WCL00_11380 [Bacteroidota bacterium]